MTPMDESIKRIEEAFGPVQLISARKVEQWLGIKDLNKTSIKIRMVGNRRVVPVQALARWLS